MDSVQLSFDDYAESRAKRDEAIAAVAAHADQNDPGWGDRAFGWLKSYANGHQLFISEECTDAAYAAGVPAPHDGRAWGKVFRKAAKESLIVKDGFGVSKRRNCSPTPRWKSLVFRNSNA